MSREAVSVLYIRERPQSLFRGTKTICVDRKRDSFQVMPAEAAREFVSVEGRTNSSRAVSEQPNRDAPQPGSAPQPRSCSQHRSHAAVARGLAALPPSLCPAEVWAPLPARHSSPRFPGSWEAGQALQSALTLTPQRWSVAQPSVSALEFIPPWDAWELFAWISSAVEALAD